MRHSVIITVMICVTVLVFGFFIWPTPYHHVVLKRPYFSQSGQTFSEEVYRINRVTGESVKILDTNPKAKATP